MDFFIFSIKIEKKIQKKSSIKKKILWFYLIFTLVLYCKYTVMPVDIRHVHYIFYINSMSLNNKSKLMYIFIVHRNCDEKEKSVNV